MRELLAIERERLKVARRIEEERKIIFPETTVIIRDIERLLEVIGAKERGDEPTKGKGSKRDRGKAEPRIHDEIDDLIGNDGD